MNADPKDQILSDVRAFQDEMRLALRKINRKYQAGWTVMIGVIIIILAAVPMTAYVVNQNTRINNIQNGALCPMFSFFLSLYHPESQKPENLARYEASFDVFRQAADKLHCPAKTAAR